MRAFISFIITIIIISFIGGAGYLIFENNEIKNKLVNAELKIQEIEYEKNRLKNIIANKNNTIRYYQNENTKINRRTEVNKNINTTNNATYTKKEETNNINKDKYAQNSSRQKPDNKILTNKKIITDNKKYQRFSNNIKLVSDSTITILDNNKLMSNDIIKGRYYPLDTINYINNIECGNNERIYTIRNECSMRISSGFDKVYLGKMESHTIKNINYKTHMIECKYNQEYGLMHDCMSKLKS